MKNLRYLQKGFFLLVMGVAVGACKMNKASDGAEHESVDLGLSVKWATCNVGANSPEEYGGYFAWGETEEKTEYSRENYKWYAAPDTTDTVGTSKGTFKNPYSKYNSVDNKTVLDPEDDVARVKWGGNWRMPTEEEFKELAEKCTWKWTTLNGVNGQLVIGPNGNSIFLPAAGQHSQAVTFTIGVPGSRLSAKVWGCGEEGYYYSTSLPERTNRYIGPYADIQFNEYGFLPVLGSNDRTTGYSVRPVIDIEDRKE